MKLKYTLEQRLERALALRRQGYNCTQAVILVFDDVTGLDNDTVARLTSGLGTGVGGLREICGVVNAMALTQGMLQSPAPEGKAASAKVAGNLGREFANANQGRIRCCDLKGKEGIRPCNDLVLQGVELLHNYFESLQQ